MVTLHMLIFEMGVEDLGVGKHTEDLIVSFSSVNKFMPSLGLNCTNESDDKPEDKQLWKCDRFHSG